MKHVYFWSHLFAFFLMVGLTVFAIFEEMYVMVVAFMSCTVVGIYNIKDCYRALSLVVGLLFLTGCQEPVTNPVVVTSTDYYHKDGGYAYSISVIDSCQYIRSGHGLAHKGNCTNNIHVYRMENK